MIDKDKVIRRLEKHKSYLIKEYEAKYFWEHIINGITVAQKLVREMPEEETKGEEKPCERKLKD